LAIQAREIRTRRAATTSAIRRRSCSAATLAATRLGAC
jgi:hypothetical protein